jgi:multidrug efflux pump subunit AcrB
VSLTAFAVRRWQVTLILVVMVAALGFSAFRSIPRSVDPVVSFPAAIVTIVLPGADATEIEETVAKPIEDVLQGLDRVREIRSSSSDGVAVISTEFEYGTDVERNLDQVVREVNTIRDRLPQGIRRVDFRRPRPSEAAVLQLALVSDSASSRRLAKYADDLRDRLNVVPGVRQTLIDGAPRPEVRVALDTGRLAEAGVAASTVATVIGAGGQELPAGSVNAEGRRYNIDAGGAYRSVEAVRAIPVRARDGRLLTVGDVAQVDWADGEQTHITRFNGQPALFVSVKQKDRSDAGTLQRALVAAVEKFRTDLPPDMKIALAFDQSNDISRRLNELARDFAIALALVLITVLPLGIRASLIVMISIPLSLAMGVFTLSLLGLTLNQLSIAGFIISLGLLVDDSIVVTENIERHIRDGDTPEVAAIVGTKQISTAVLGATGVLIFAFLPITMLPEGGGDFVRGLPLAVMATVASSLVISLTVIPFAASRILKPHGGEGNRFLRWLTAGIHRFYAPILHRALDRPWAWLVGSLTICIGAFGLVPVIGFSLFPSADAPYILVRVETPQGSTIARTDAAVRAVSNIIQSEGLVANRMDNAGRGNPQIYYNIFPREEASNYGDVFVTLKEWNNRDGPPLLARLRKRLSAFPDARVSVINFENGPPIEAPIAVRISGPALPELKRIAGDVERVLRARPGLRDVNNPVSFDRVDLDLGLDEAKAALLGVAPGEARRAVRLAISGETASQLRDDEGDSWPIIVRLPMAANQPVSALDKVYVPTTSGGSVPLSQLATPQLKSEFSVIFRYGLQRVVTVLAYTQPGTLTSEATAAVQAELAKLKLPAGYRLTFGGEAEAATRNFSGLGPAILLAVFGIFGVLVLEFGRFRETIVVAGVIPLGTFGGLMALLMTGGTLSFIAVIGFVALIGIEIKNSILLVDFTTQLREQGMGLRDAIEKAGEIRFLPVLLTSVTAIGGLLPLALGGGSLYAPLAWVIIGGLVSSTFLSRIITPVMYLLAARGGVDPVPHPPIDGPAAASV